LAYVQLPDKRFLNEALLTEGFAYADLRFRHSFYYKYQNLQASARRQKKGLWPDVKREQLPEWLKRKKPKIAVRKDSIGEQINLSHREYRKIITNQCRKASCG